MQSVKSSLFDIRLPINILHKLKSLKFIFTLNKDEEEKTIKLISLKVSSAN